MGLSKAGAQLAGCFGRLQTAACSPSLQPLAHPAETWTTAARASSKLLQPLPRSGFAETTQPLLHPSLHPGMCCPAVSRGLLLLPAPPFPLPAGVSCLISPTGCSQWGLRAPSCSSGPGGSLPVAWCREKVRSRVRSRTVLAGTMVAVWWLFLPPPCCPARWL